MEYYGILNSLDNYFASFPRKENLFFYFDKKFNWFNGTFVKIDFT